MFGFGSSSNKDLDSTIPLKDALYEQRQNPDYDCLPCRLMGSAAFAGLGVYTYASGMSDLRKREREILKSGSKFGIFGRRVALGGLSGLLVGLGAYRLIG